MEIKYLADTNIFLEILLLQEKTEKCKEILRRYKDEIVISDFSLHSIGVILFKHRKELIYFKFIVDVVSKVKIVTLPLSSYKEFVKIRERYNLDFDDAYQFQISIEKGLKIITMDKDFDRVTGVIEVINV